MDSRERHRYAVFLEEGLSQSTGLRSIPWFGSLDVTPTESWERYGFNTFEGGNVRSLTGVKSPPPHDHAPCLHVDGETTDDVFQRESVLWEGVNGTVAVAVLPAGFSTVFPQVPSFHDHVGPLPYRPRISDRRFGEKKMCPLPCCETSGAFDACYPVVYNPQFVSVASQMIHSTPVLLPPGDDAYVSLSKKVGVTPGMRPVV